MDKFKLFRYSGAKTQFIDDVNYLLNRYKASGYVEAFLGSGAIFLNTANPNFNRFYLNDIDRNIIRIFESFKNINYKTFKDNYNYVMNTFGNIEKDKEAFQEFKKWFNKNVWKSNTNEEGIFIMILASSCINSFFNFSGNGFCSSYGNRNFAKSYDEYTHYYINKKLNSNVSITNLDFEEFTKFMESENQEDLVYFLDPPYFNQGDTTSYSKNFKEDRYNYFLNFIKNSKSAIVYTDVKHDDLDWEYRILRKTMVNTGPSTSKFENGFMEVAYYNK